MGPQRTGLSSARGNVDEKSELNLAELVGIELLAMAGERFEDFRPLPPGA